MRNATKGNGMSERQWYMFGSNIGEIQRGLNSITFTRNSPTADVIFRHINFVLAIIINSEIMHLKFNVVMVNLIFGIYFS